jgi:hypothetical protein
MRRTTLKILELLCYKKIHFCSLFSYKLGPQGPIKSHLRMSCNVTRRPLICILIARRWIALKIQYRAGWIDNPFSLCTSNIFAHKERDKGKCPWLWSVKVFRKNCYNIPGSESMIKWKCIRKNLRIYILWKDVYRPRIFIKHTVTWRAG